MNQPLDFVTHDLDLMMPGSQPMLTGGPMYNTGVYGSQQPGAFGSSYGRPFWVKFIDSLLSRKYIVK